LKTLTPIIEKRLQEKGGTRTINFRRISIKAKKSNGQIEQIRIHNDEMTFQIFN
jgi:hypothetical protein